MNAANPATSSMLRQRWLEAGVDALRAKFAAVNYTVPAEVRVSVGFPKGSHGKGRAIGQCWSVEASSDKHAEIFISPELRDGVQILGVLAHEIAHAIVGTKAGHKKPFKRAAEAVGLIGKMTATVGGVEFDAWAAKLIADIGPFPGGSLSPTFRKTQSTRLLKCSCDGCGYTVRVTRKWVETAGTPICPTDQEPMACDAIGDDSDDE